VKRVNRVIEETLARLSNELVAINPKKLPSLGIPDTLIDAIVGVHAMKSPPARKRQLRLVRSELRGIDWAGLQHRLASLVLHGTAPVAPTDPVALARESAEAQWVARLIGEGMPGLEAFLREFPRADRTHLRQLVRAVDRSTHERRAKALQRLERAVQEFLR
jgi:ribosomal 50S subunit-associated protein YjgA (DUF615 family)